MKIEEYITKHFTAERNADFPDMFDVLMDGCFVDIGHTYEGMCRMRTPYDAWYEVPGCPQKVYVKYAGDVKFLHVQKVEKVESYRDFDRHCDSRVPPGMEHFQAGIRGGRGRPLHDDRVHRFVREGTPGKVLQPPRRIRMQDNGRLQAMRDSVRHGGRIGGFHARLFY